MSFNNGATSAVLEFRRCTLVAIDTLSPAVTGNFSSAYLLQTKGAFLEFCRKTPGARNRALFRYLQLSGFATDCPVLRFNEERWKRAEQRMDNFDQSLIGTRKLIQLGAKTLIASQKAAKVELREIREDIRELTAAQKRTDQKFDRLVELLSRRNPNGRH